MIETIKTAIIPLIESQDCTLEDIEYVKDCNEWYLRIFIDKNEGYLDMDTCVAVSELISARLDEIDVINNEYYLEVSSPGIERELKTFDKVKQNINSFVHIDFYNPQNGMNQVEGTLIDIVDEDLTIQYMLKAVRKKMVVPYSNVKFIRLAVKF